MVFTSRMSEVEMVYMDKDTLEKTHQLSEKFRKHYHSALFNGQIVCKKTIQEGNTVLVYFYELLKLVKPHVNTDSKIPPTQYDLVAEHCYDNITNYIMFMANDSGKVKTFKRLMTARLEFLQEYEPLDFKIYNWYMRSFLGKGITQEIESTKDMIANAEQISYLKSEHEDPRDKTISLPENKPNSLTNIVKNIFRNIGNRFNNPMVECLC